MRILLLGCNGQVGWELQRALAPLGTVSACGRDRPAPWRMDLAQAEGLAAWIDAHEPEVIVNAAAYTAVDRAEDEPGLAHAVNARAPAVLAAAARRHGALLVHYSTDFVFDGDSEVPYDEDAATAPLGAYGRSKAAGEEAIRASGCRHLILRTSWVHAARGRNFVLAILGLAAQREELQVVVDQLGAPTGADLVADVTAHTIRAVRADPSLEGTYHCTAAGETSRHGCAHHVVAWAQRHGWPLMATPERVLAVATTERPTRARRPRNGRLDTTRLRRRFGLALAPWQQGVERTLVEWRQQRTETIHR
jgi:dTDP-4-dehydrorhamnose reductase